MPVVISDTNPVARKEHECSLCLRTIQPGETYHRQRAIYDDPYTFKACTHCSAFADLYREDWWYDSDIGYTREDVLEWEPPSTEALEHKKLWMSRWSDNGVLVPTIGGR